MSGSYDLRTDLFDYYPPIQERVRWIIGAKDLADARKKLDDYNLGNPHGLPIYSPVDDDGNDPGAEAVARAASARAQAFHRSGRFRPYRRTACRTKACRRKANRRLAICASCASTAPD